VILAAGTDIGESKKLIGRREKVDPFLEKRFKHGLEGTKATNFQIGNEGHGVR
jgi:hypothetical protein